MVDDVCVRCRYQIPETDLGLSVDRIEIHIGVPRVDYEKLSGDRLREISEVIRARVQNARNTQRARFSKLDSKHPIFCNADMRVGEIWRFCKLQDECQRLMRAAISQLFAETIRGLERVAAARRQEAVG